MNEQESIDTTLLQWVEQAAQASSPHALRILEIGCGDGSRIEALSAYGSVVAVDENEEVVQAAQAAHPGYDIRQMDYCNLSFEAEFDLVYSQDTFSMLADQIGLLKSVSRALVVEGTLLVRMGAEGNIAQVQEGIASALEKHSGGYSCQFCFPKETAYRRILDIVGFSAEDIEVSQQMIVLPGGPDGLRQYATERFSGALGIYRPEDRALVLDDFEEECREALWNDDAGTWMADVCELRLKAKKQRETAGLGGSSQFTVLGA